MADEQEEAYLRALRRLEKEKDDKKNQQNAMGCIMFVIIAFAIATCVGNSGNNSGSDNGADYSAPSSRQSATSYPPRLTDPTVAEWRAANEFDRDGAVHAWTQALSPGMSSTQIAARSRELYDCIEEAQPAAPPEWKVRENLAATCALMLGWR